MPDFDVVVVGSGFAGLTAALFAHDEGATVLIAESESVIGGASRLSGGGILAANTVVQRSMGIEDSADDLFFDYVLANQFEVKPGLVRRLADDGAAVVDWVIALGVEIADLTGGADQRKPRSHRPEGRGQHLVDVLARQCKERGIDIALGQRVDRLVVEDGVVRGVAVGDDDLSASAVVLATGGFGANWALIEKYLPTLAEKGSDWLIYRGPEGSRGDGLALGEQVGASTVGFDIAAPLLIPFMAGVRDSDSSLPSWMLLLGRDGRRLCVETTPYGFLHGVVNAAGGRAFGIFDSKSLADNGTDALPTFNQVLNGQPRPADLWTRDGIERLVETKAVLRAQTLEELASSLSLPVDAVVGAVRRYNRSAAAGIDLDFEKDPRFLRAVEHPPFYGVEVRPASFGHVGYGLEIDSAGAVLDRASSEIPGLYAAGECTGGVIGPRYMGTGNSVGRCLVFGRAAGRSAASYALACVQQ